jgi:hypothetical protein
LTLQDSSFTILAAFDIYRRQEISLMTKRADTPTTSNEPTRLDRRELIKRALTVGTVGYVAPLIAGAVKPVSAQGFSGNECGDPSCLDPSCNGDGSCGCVTTAEGGTACVERCCSFDDCDSSDECDDGWVCFTQGCCDEQEEPDGAGYCIPLCGSDDLCGVEIDESPLAAGSGVAAGTQPRRRGWTH